MLFSKLKNHLTDWKERSGRKLITAPLPAVDFGVGFAIKDKGFGGFFSGGTDRDSSRPATHIWIETLRNLRPGSTTASVTCIGLGIVLSYNYS
jgi:hypothetical protein